MWSLIARSLALALAMAVLAVLIVHVWDVSGASVSPADAQAEHGSSSDHRGSVPHRLLALQHAIGCPSPSSPTQRTAQSAAMQLPEQTFEVQVSREKAELPEGFEALILAGAHHSYELWRDWLGEARLQPSKINMRFVGDDARFEAIYDADSPAGYTTTGFYRIRNNEAVVRYTAPHKRYALGNAFHEMSHLITAWHLGPTPPWLNEGIAEYVETMRVTPEAAVFTLSQQHLRILSRVAPTSLEELTGLSRSDWGSQDAPRRYASAWSLISFLLDSTDGRRTLQGVIESAFEQRCNPTTNLENALAQYPGGTRSLESDWNGWVSQRTAARISTALLDD
ncbi:MAG: hypothetical protein Cons2KO_18890 [Congregibacter sp.]